ncbi:MAG: AtpZ/AtpI family protein [Vicinamibacterales bacterium]
MEPTEPKPTTTADTMRTIGGISTVGFSFVLAILLGAWLGRTLDKWLGSSPWLFFLFLVFGFVAGSLNVYRTSQRFLK